MTKRWILIGIPAVFLAVLFYLPMAGVLTEGLRAPGPGGGFSFQRVRGLLVDPYIQHLIRFTTWQAFLSSLLSVAIGVPLAYVLTNRSFPGRRIVSALTMVPFVLPAITVALGFLLMFGTNGWLNQTLDALFGVKVRLLHSLWAILLAHAFYNAPVVARTTQAAWEQLDPALEESARSLGAKPLAVWRDVTMPGLLPGVMSGAILAFIYSFLSFPIVLALGGSRYSTLEVEIYTQVRVLLDYETGAALAGVQAALSLLFSYVFLRAQGASGDYRAGAKPRPLRPLFGFSDRAHQTALLWLFLAGATLLFLGPVATILVDSLRDPKGGLSVAAYSLALSTGHDAHVGDAPLASVGNSLRFGLGAAVIAVGMGVSFTFGLVRGLRRRRPFLETLALAPLVVSSVALGFGALIAFRRPPFDVVSPDQRVILVHAILAFPFVVRAFRPVLENADMRLLEAARSLGAGRIRAFVGVELPLMATGLLVAFAFAFALSVSEMSAAMMLARPGLVTMPLSVYRFLAARDFQAASAMATVLIAVTGGAFVVLELAGMGLRRELGPRRARRER